MFILIVVFIIIMVFIVLAVNDSEKQSISSSLKEHIENKGIGSIPDFTINKDGVYSTWDSVKQCVIFLKKENVKSQIKEYIFENYQCCKMIHVQEIGAVKVIAYIDDVHRKVLICEYNYEYKVEDLKITEIKIDDILEMAIEVEFANSSKRSTLSTIGRAAIGGVVGGSVGSLVGASTSSIETTSSCTFLCLKLTLNNVQTPNVYINIWKHSNGLENLKQLTFYKRTIELQDTISVIINKTSEEKVQSEKSLVANTDELLKLVELRKNGYITEEEFETLKKKLIN